jgi:hypothetical protein
MKQFFLASAHCMGEYERFISLAVCAGIKSKIRSEKNQDTKTFASLGAHKTRGLDYLGWSLSLVYRKGITSVSSSMLQYIIISSQPNSITLSLITQNQCPLKKGLISLLHLTTLKKSKEVFPRLTHKFEHLFHIYFFFF